MGNDNSQITFPIEGNNQQNKIKINSKKIKQKDISNNIQVNPKLKGHKNQKILKKNYIVPRISTTPDRNINIPGINKNSNNNKRYISYEKPLKQTQNNENKSNVKKKDLKNNNYKIATKNKLFGNNKSIFHITNLLNTIYSFEIENKLNKKNELHLGIKNKNNNYNYIKDINVMFDSIFKYNYFHKNVIKPIKIISNSKNKNKAFISKNSQNIRNESTNQKQKEEKLINDNHYHNKKNVANKNTDVNTIVSITSNKKVINPNNTLKINQFDIDNEVVSVNNKKPI